MALPTTDFLAQAQRWLNDAQFALVLEQTEAALAQHPDDHELLILKSDSLLGLGRFAEALPLGKHLVTTAPGVTASWLVLCRALRGLGFEDLALRVNTFALTRAAPDFDAVCFRGDTLYDSNRFDEAREAYERALHAFGSQPRAWRQWYNYSTCLWEAGRVADSYAADRRALRGLQQVLATGRVTADAQLEALWFHQGMLYFRLEQWVLAETAFMQALSTDYHSLAALWLRQTYRKEGKRIVAVLIAPWAIYVAGRDLRRKDKARESAMAQRLTITPETLEDIERIIASNHWRDDQDNQAW